MAKMICHNCARIITYDTVKEARQKAVLHMALAGCIMVFGYSDNKARQLNLTGYKEAV